MYRPTALNWKWTHQANAAIEISFDIKKYLLVSKYK